MQPSISTGPEYPDDRVVDAIRGSNKRRGATRLACGPGKDNVRRVARRDAERHKGGNAVAKSDIGALFGSIADRGLRDEMGGSLS
jgi:hypothetical protein